MGIGVDIAVFSENKAIDRVVLVSKDSECAATLKHGGRAGFQLVIVELPAYKTAPEVLSPSDFKRVVRWT